MSSNRPYGTLRPEGDRLTLRFERYYAASTREVWSALTEPERFARWLAPGQLEPRRGGRVWFNFGDDGFCEGEILVWAPPRVLEYDWRQGGQLTSVVRFQLTPERGGTALSVDHRDLLVDAAAYGAEWHAHLDGLTGELAGVGVDWPERYRMLLPSYEQRVAAVVG